MRVREGARVAAFLLFSGVLSAGLWQCTRETTSSGSAGLQILLSSSGADSSTTDSVEIEVKRSGSIVAADMVAVDSLGHFSSTLAVAAGEGYDVRVFGWGEGPGMAPDSSAQGVLAFGCEGEIDLLPGRLTEVEIEMSRAQSSVLEVTGQEGYHTLQVKWSEVPGASDYTLGWQAGDGASQGCREGITDTSVVLAWDSAEGFLLLATETDSLLFRVCPHFDVRPGVFGPGLWKDLSVWLDLPHLIANPIPAHEAVVDAETLRVWLAFDRLMDESSFAAGLHWVQESTAEEVSFGITQAPSAEGALYCLDPDSGQVQMDETYRLMLTPDIVDTTGRAFDGDPDTDGLQSIYVSWSTMPYEPLQVLGVDSEHGSMDVELGAELRLILSRRVDASTLSNSSFYVTDQYGIKVAGQRDTTARADTIRWRPQEDLWYNTTYTAHVTRLLLDVYGKPFDGDPSTYPQREAFMLPFATVQQPASPYVKAVCPEPNALAVEVDAHIEVTFNEPIDPVSVSFGSSFQLLREGSITLPGSFAADSTQRIYTFKPNHSLDRNKLHVLKISAVRDFDGNRLDQDSIAAGYQDFTSEFRTENPPKVTNSSPAPGDSAVAVDAALWLTFSTALDPGTIATGSVRLLRGEVPVACARQLAANGCDLTITPDEPLSNLTTYTMVVDTLVAGTDGSLFDQNLTLAGRQIFEGFFTTKPESLHPRVIDIHPADGDSNVAISDSVYIAFSIPVKPTTLTIETIKLSRIEEANEIPLVGTILKAADSLSATFTPQYALENGAHHRVEVTTFVRSASGFRLDQEPDAAGLQDFESEFWTIPERIAPYVVHSDPSLGQVEVPVTDPIILDFSEAMDSSSVAGAFSLRSAWEENVEGEGSLGGEGMNIWVFVPSDTLLCSTVYTAGVDTTAVDLVGNALDDSSAVPGAQPFEIWFRTESESIPPRVRWTDPLNGSDSVSVVPTVRVAFTERMWPEYVTEERLYVAPDGGQPIGGSFMPEPGDSIFTWTPAQPLVFSTLYRVVADTLLRDPGGNLLDQDPDSLGRQLYEGFFTTMPETLAPRVVSAFPEIGAPSVPLTAVPALGFSEPMDTLSLKEEGVITFRRGPEGEEEVGFTLWIAPSADSVNLVPDVQLAENMRYQVGVSVQARDLVGNLFDQYPEFTGQQAYAGHFWTEHDQESPWVETICPEADSQHVLADVVVRLEFSEPLDPASVDSTTLFLSEAGGPVVPAQLLLDELDQGIAELDPYDALAESTTYWVVATTLLTDLAGNRLDQEPGEPLYQDFSSSFTVDGSPIIQWAQPGGICAFEDTALVSFDASGSYDPADPGDPNLITTAIWGWGDGSDPETLSAPAGLIAEHDFPCQDIKGCNGLDDDDDGDIDECDESYPVTLTIMNVQGLASSDSSGVSFCAFLVRSSEPDSGAVGVSPTDSVRVTFSRPVDIGSVDPASVLFTAGAAGTAVDFGAALDSLDFIVVLIPAEPLEADTTYTVTVTPEVTDESGVHLDQWPCSAGEQGCTITFTAGD